MSGTTGARCTDSRIFKGLLLQAAIEQILGLDDAEHGIGVCFIDRQARMRRLDDAAAVYFIIVDEIDHVDFVARSHHGADGPVGKPHHARDHRALFRLQHAGAFGFRHQRPDLLVSDAARGDRALTQ